MKTLHKIVIIVLISGISMANVFAQDWANLNRFQADNEKIHQTKNTGDRIVFMGNSITEGWNYSGSIFSKNTNFINRGISGQTTPQMLLRFRQDVINLEPKAVVILAGINDIAGNTGPSTIEMIVNNIQSMCEIAEANNIEIILCSVLPAYDFSWKPNMNPADKVIALNQLMKKYAIEKEYRYVDYFNAMVDHRNGLDSKYTNDEVHPTKKGYELMESIVLKELNF